MSRIRALLSHFAPLTWLALVFLSLSSLTRIVLALGQQVDAGVGDWLYFLVVGLGYDLVTLLYVGLPMLFVLWLLPSAWLRRRRGRWPLELMATITLAVLLFVACAEWLFWDEFQTRFNFIAVDYLVYTTEVLGNIRESYPVGWVLSAIALVAAVVLVGTRRGRRVGAATVGFGARSAVAAGWLALAVLATWQVDAGMKEASGNAYVDSLAGNGIYEFFAAYRQSDLDYDRFYRTESDATAYADLRRLLTTPDARFVDDDPEHITRDIDSPGQERHLNVVLISVESLSAWYSGTYGRRDSLTPNLDRLAADSLVFKRLYATGTRTVRGLEALSLSVPPTPGESIVKRPGNEQLFSLATVFDGKGYASEFIYGGYGLFDNMNYFFGHNGYAVHDRADIPDDQVHFANIWGVADEDLYTLALNRFDADFAAGKPFFGHIMTTSNHRPYTFPEGRIDAPQKQRHSAVRYTDWAIGDFLERAKSKPWFANTVFVITADHCASSGGIARLPVFRYHIPLWIYSPGNVAPGTVDRMLSQIDVGPTLLGLLGFDYRSEFYGRNVLVDGADALPERALIGNYQRLGYLHGQQLIELAPGARVDAVRPDYARNQPQPAIAPDPQLTREAIAYYQTASERYETGRMRHDAPMPAAAGP